MNSYCAACRQWLAGILVRLGAWLDPGATPPGTPGSRQPVPNLPEAPPPVPQGDADYYSGRITVSYEGASDYGGRAGDRSTEAIEWCSGSEPWGERGW